MPGPGWENRLGVLMSSSAAGPSVTTNAADTSILTATYTLPANFLIVGDVLRIKASGAITTTAAGTLTFKVKFGSVIVFTGGAQTVVTSLGPLDYELEIMLTCRAIGATTTANFVGSGKVVSGIYGAAGAVTTFALPSAGPTVGTGFDSTASNAIDLTANFSLTGQTLVNQEYMIESLT